MHTYRRVALVVALALSMVAVLGSASNARTSHGSVCSVRSLPSFVAQGEAANHSSVADIVRVRCDPVFAEEFVTLRAQQLYDRCHQGLSWSVPFPASFREGPSFRVQLDDNGRANAALWGGPSCAAGTSLITAHLETAPFVTVRTTFTVLSPRDTPPGVFALPAREIEDSTWSSVATVIQVEFPSVFSQRLVNVTAGELFARCQQAPRLVWVGPNERVIGAGVDTVTLQLDNNGNAFVVVLGGWSCASGPSTIEASLVGPPFTTYTTQFTILSPR